MTTTVLDSRGHTVAAASCALRKRRARRRAGTTVFDMGSESDGEDTAPDHCFSGEHHGCRWRGAVLDEARILRLSAQITERATDESHGAEVRAKLRELSGTGVDPTWLETFLADGEDNGVTDWQVGEAVAECLLAADHGIVFPWNGRRDEKVPKASLPGADLVGLLDEAQRATLVFGEVKSSADSASPPGVLHGRSGMIHQLETLATDQKVRFKLIRWLHARTASGDTADLYERAVSTFLESQGKAILLVGCLMRDNSVTPTEQDVLARGKHLGDAVKTSTDRVELLTWYLPAAMADWTKWVAA